MSIEFEFYKGHSPFWPFFEHSQSYLCNIASYVHIRCLNRSWKNDLLTKFKPVNSVGPKIVKKAILDNHNSSLCTSSNCKNNVFLEWKLGRNYSEICSKKLNVNKGRFLMGRPDIGRNFSGVGRKGRNSDVILNNYFSPKSVQNRSKFARRKSLLLWIDE